MASPSPTLLDSAAGCPGHMRINNQLLGLCVACDRQGRGGQIEPEAKRLSGGEFFCPNRRYLPPEIRVGTAVPGTSVGAVEGGVSAADHRVHACTGADSAIQGKPLTVGPHQMGAMWASVRTRGVSI